jgi:hypothetical protein
MKNLPLSLSRMSAASPAVELMSEAAAPEGENRAALEEKRCLKRTKEDFCEAMRLTKAGFPHLGAL